MLVVVGALGILEDGLPVVREVDDDGGRLAVALEDLRDDLVIVVDQIRRGKLQCVNRACLKSWDKVAMVEPLPLVPAT